MMQRLAWIWIPFTGLGLSILPFTLVSPLFAQDRTQPRLLEELPRIAPQEPADAMREIQIKPGYQLELAAAEPEVRDPVALAFDDEERMYVVEMCDYSEQDQDFLGTIRRLEDRDQDGRYETSVLFADKLSWPTGAICFDGGIFVAAAPDIWYLKDTDGDGKADVRRQVFTGFGRQNVQGLLNSFCWGLDNRIYCQVSSSGATITRPDRPDLPPVAASGRDFSFDPITFDIRLESGGGQHGMSFDDWGRRFVCHNSDHLQMFVYPDRYASLCKVYPLPPSRQSIAADGPQANVYRLSPVEPWRIVRTRMRVTNQTPGMIEGGGRASGYFTSATGITIYRGDAFPSNMSGVAIVGDVGSNIVHRKKLTESGSSMAGHRIDSESEFLAATDTWFRPVQFANTPDGTLYVADLYREVIEHPKSLPEEIKQHLDLTSGRDRGRIYRIAPIDFKHTDAPKLSQQSPAQWVKALESANGWKRDTASRLLYEQLSLRATAPERIELLSALEKTAIHSSLPQARLHALGLLARTSESREAHVRGISDAHPRVREWSLLWLEDRFGSDEQLQKLLPKLAEDPDPRVRLQLALSLVASDLHPVAKSELSYETLVNSPSDPWIAAACFNAIGSQATAILFKQLDASPSALDLAKALPMGRLTGKLASADQLATLDKRLAGRPKSDANSMQLIAEILNAIQERSIADAKRDELFDSLPTLATLREQLIKKARADFGNGELPIADRQEAIRRMMWQANESDISALAALIHQREPQDIQVAAANALRRFTSAQVPVELLKSWTMMSPKLRSIASDILFSRAAWVEALVAQAEKENFLLTDLDVIRLNGLRNDRKLKDRVEKLLASSTFGTRSEVFETYRAALNMPGDKQKGKSIFAQSCSACHKLEGVGYELAPSLASFQFRGAEAILQNIVEPNREVNPQYVSYTIVTEDDRVLSGMIQSESAASVTLVRGENQTDTIDRSDIAEMKSSKLSLMPEGLERQIDVPGMADLLAYLMAVK